MPQKKTIQVDPQDVAKALDQVLDRVKFYNNANLKVTDYKVTVDAANNKSEVELELDT